MYLASRGLSLLVPTKMRPPEMTGLAYVCEPSRAAHRTFFDRGRLTGEEGLQRLRRRVGDDLHPSRVEPDVGVKKSEPVVVTIAADRFELDSGTAVDDPEVRHQI